MRNIYFALILCIASVCGLTSCDSSSEETINSTGKAVVTFTSDTIYVKENKGLFNIPFKITGERNGLVKVNVAIIDNDSCKEDKNFIITSKSINISTSKNSALVECNTVDDRKINNDRTFIVKFALVEGAAINSEAASIVVKILDNDNTPYDRMAGKWTITAVNDLSIDRQEFTWNVTIETADVNDSINYGSLLYIKPFADGGGNVVADYALPMHFKWDESNKIGKIEIKQSEFVGTADMQLEDDAEITNYTILTFSFNGTVKGDVSTDLNSVNIPNQILGKFFKTDGLEEVDIYKTVAFGWSNMVLTRK